GQSDPGSGVAPLGGCDRTARAALAHPLWFGCGHWLDRRGALPPVAARRAAGAFRGSTDVGAAHVWRLLKGKGGAGIRTGAGARRARARGGLVSGPWVLVTSPASS